MPLSTFAADYELNNGLCAVFVEYLDSSDADSKQIILGGMFYQSFYARYTLSTFGASIQLYVNTNALPGTYLGNQTVSQSPISAFTINPLQLHTDTQSEQNGLPTFNA